LNYRCQSIGDRSACRRSRQLGSHLWAGDYVDWGFWPLLAPGGFLPPLSS